jgi:hypothetical protein
VNTTHRFGSAEAASQHEPHEPEGAATGPAAAERLRLQFAELIEYWQYYLATRTDRFKLSVRRAAIAAAVGLVGLLILVAVVTASAFVAIIGVAGGLGVLFGDRLWLGYLATGMFLLAAIVGGVYFAAHRAIEAARERMIRKYEQRRQQQRARFGHNVTDRAGSAGTPASHGQST